MLFFPSGRAVIGLPKVVLYTAELVGCAALDSGVGLELRKQVPGVYGFVSTGVGKCPMTWEYWTSPEIVAIKKTINT